MINSLSTDFLIRVKNASLAGDKHVTAPNSKFVRSLADLLKKNGMAGDTEISADAKSLKVALVYQDHEPLITNVKLFSKPGRRWYEKAIRLPWGQTPASLIIVSTSKGLLSQREAKKSGLGGEIIAEVY